jgi:hypothetical protein
MNPRIDAPNRTWTRSPAWASPLAANSLAGGILFVLAATAAYAQSGPQWWSLNPSMPPGTPPTVTLMTTSNPQQTVLQVTIHGFYYENVVAMGQTFRRLRLVKGHDEAQYRVVGRPELPAMHHLLGALVGNQVGPPEVQVIEEIQIPGALIHPYQPPIIDTQPATTFLWDQAFYQTSQPFPAVRAAARGYQGRFGGLDLVAAETYPFRAVPVNQVLMVMRRYQVTIPHPGTGVPDSHQITRRQARQHELLLANQPVVQAFWQPQLDLYAGDYLFVTWPTFIEEIEPLAEQKRRRGYDVTIATTDQTGSTCAEIKDYIADWWSNGNPDRDHYVLLVGDTWAIPVCSSEDTTTSDLVYACIDGLGADGLPDVYPEVRIGRFTCDTAADCTDMVTKTLTYEAGYFGSGDWLGDVLLTCHQTTADGRPGANLNQYRDAQESVRLYPYTDPPAFSTLYGQSGPTNAQVRAAINDGQGVVCYRGHGGTIKWGGFGGWSTTGEDFISGDVTLLANDNKTPVVLSIACVNNDISGLYNGGTDAIGEAWMKTTERAVAHFGATDGSERDANDILDLELFETIYEDGHAILGEAIAGAQLATIIASPDFGEFNAWLYLLLGDPELEVWREPPPPLVLSGHPAQVPTGPSIFVVQVHHGSGLRSVPVPFAIVSLYKNGEVIVNRYTDLNGQAEIPIDPTSPGTMHVTAYTDLGPEGVGLAEVQVTGPSAIGEAAAPETASLILTPPPSAAAGPVEVGVELGQAAAGLDLRLINVMGRTIADVRFGPLAAGVHRLRLAGLSAGAVPSGVYWIDARARTATPAGAEVQTRTRWLRLR